MSTRFTLCAHPTKFNVKQTSRFVFNVRVCLDATFSSLHVISFAIWSLHTQQSMGKDTERQVSKQCICIALYNAWLVITKVLRLPRVNKGWQFYLPPTRLSTYGMSHLPLLPSRSSIAAFWPVGLLFSRPDDARRLSWPDGWLGDILIWFTARRSTILVLAAAAGNRTHESRPSSRKSNALITRQRHHHCYATSLQTNYQNQLRRPCFPLLCSCCLEFTNCWHRWL